MSKTAVLADPAMDEAPDMAAKRITIVLGDAQPIMLDGLDMFFTAEGFSVLARCVNGDELLQAVRKFQPSIVVLDLKLPGKDGLAVLRELKCDNAGTRAIVLTGSADDAEVSEALRLGVGGVVLKEMPSHLLVECVRKVHAGEQWVEKRSAGGLLQKLLHRETAMRQLALQLTPRELEIVRLVAMGLRNRAIADRLGVTEGTIKIHLHNIYRKLNVESRMALMLYAQSKGLA